MSLPICSLFNGNSELYSDFVNHEGTPFFNQNVEVSKWEMAAIIAKEAIDIAVAQGAAIYQFTSSPPKYDETNYDNPFYKTFYDVKFSVLEKWNPELLWGDSSPVNDLWRLQSGVLIKDPTASSVQAAWQWIAPTMRMAELF